MAPHLFAGLRVSSFTAARPWYERLLGEVSFLPHETEAVWTLGDGRSIYVVEDAERSGGGAVTVFADDLDAAVAAIAARGLEPSERETYGNGVRKAIYRDADGNEVGFAGGAVAARGRAPSRAGPRGVRAEVERAWEILGRLNALPPGDFEAMRALLAELTGHELDPSVRVLPPFHTDSGRRLRFGRNVFVNHGCTAMDFGGIDIGDDVMIGPNVQLISSSHPLDPATRRSSITTAPIRIGRGAWIAAGATILQGVTVGEDAVVAAGAVVTKDVPPRTLVAGVPGEVIRDL